MPWGEASPCKGHKKADLAVGFVSHLHHSTGCGRVAGALA